MSEPYRSSITSQSHHRNGNWLPHIPTQRVRCFKWLVRESGTVPNCKGSCTNAVFQPEPRSMLEQQTSSAREPIGKPPMDCRAALLNTYPDPVHQATPMESLIGSDMCTKVSRL